MDRLLRTQKIILVVFAFLTIGSAILAPRLKFTFDFEQFFPQKDPDLEYYLKFVEEFESDDNFMLVALRRPEGAFDQTFLQNVEAFTLAARDLPSVTKSQSLTRLRLPVKTPFGFTALPALHIDDTTFYADDKRRVMADERFKNTLISEDGTTLLVYLQTVERIQLDDSKVLLNSIDSLIKSYGFVESHTMGRAGFQVALIETTQWDVIISGFVAIILVSIILWLIFRSWRTNMIMLSNIGLSMLIFLGLMSLFGRELSAMSALYPVLLVIIGTSDMMHLLSKYLDEHGRGRSRAEARSITIREIGLATFMTAATTSAGFLTLLTSRIKPIQEFGINAACGVMVAYITSVLFGLALISFFTREQLTRTVPPGKTSIWDKIMGYFYTSGKNYPRRVWLISLLLFGGFVYGCSIIKTNYSISDMLPLRQKVTDDFFFFEKQFAGYRPIEFAVEAQGEYLADDYAVLTQIDTIEKHIRQYPEIRSVSSVTTLYKSVHQLQNSGEAVDFIFPKDSLLIDSYRPMVDKMPATLTNVMISKDNKKTRVSTRILDLGADSVMYTGDRIMAWIGKNTDSTIVKVARTGTGYVLDKNAMYVRKDLVEGILLEVAIIALLMGLVLRDIRMVIIFLIPNLFPLFFAGAVMGYFGIDLDAGVSMVFTVVFGIAIDDTIHFLSSFQLNRRKGQGVEQALETTMFETGKPVLLTTIILFVGFLVMLFSHYPPTHTVGILIAITLFSALLSDVYLNPLLIRWWIKDVKLTKDKDQV